MAANWRLLEAEIVDILCLDGWCLTETTQGDKMLLCPPDADMNITCFAQALAERVELRNTAVQVKS